jgi:cell wall assembly regulator SMI1
VGARFIVVPSRRGIHNCMVRAMRGLAEAPSSLDTQLGRVSPMAKSRLAPGLQRHETTAALNRLGLIPPRDVIDWLAWHNGSATPATPLWSSVPIGPGWWVVSLDFLTHEYGQWTNFIADNLPEDLPIEQGWLPVVLGEAGGHLVVDCNGEPSEPTQCALRTPQGRRQETLPFSDCLGYWADAIATGRWSCDEERHNYPNWLIYPDRGTVPPSARLTGLLT